MLSVLWHSPPPHHLSETFNNQLQGVHVKKLVIAALAGAMLASYQVRSEETTAKTDWSDKLTLKGDVRFRYETIDDSGATETRDRARIRARLGAYATVNDEVDAAIALASGNDDPTSSNQTLDEGFSSKEINLDLAYIDLHPELIGGNNIILGKMKMPFIAVNDLMWDTDVNPEGAGLNIELSVDDNIKLLVNGGGFWVEERSSADDTMLYGAQAAAEIKSDALKILGGASYFTYDNIEGYAPIFDSEDGFGNSVNEDEEGALTYATGFDIIELFAKIGFDLGLPVELAGNYVMNQDADDDDTGYMLGLKLGKLKKTGSFEFGYSYRELEADAVLGIFADSDAWGGGTDGDSHKLCAGYQVAENVSAHLTYFISTQGLDNGDDYDRLQADVIVKF
jgi:hypothetical protein